MEEKNQTAAQDQNPLAPASVGIVVASVAASVAVAIVPGHQYLLYLFPSHHLFQPSPNAKELRNSPDQTQPPNKQHQRDPLPPPPPANEEP
jgi:hypothetical protein